VRVAVAVTVTVEVTRGTDVRLSLPAFLVERRWSV
jgi:hypothetical protein